MQDVNILITLPFPEPMIARLRKISPRLKIRVHPVQTADELPAELLKDVEVLYSSPSLPKPELVPNLRWIQFHFAGLDAVANHPLVRSGIEITTSSGTAAPQMAEFAIMFMLALGRGMPRLIRDRATRSWSEDYFDKHPPTELRHSQVGIVGYGSVGRQVARLCQSFDAKVVAIKRNIDSSEDTGYGIPGLGDPEGTITDHLYTSDEICTMVALCDFVVVCSPLTPETRGIVNQQVIGSMKPTAYLIDISRGGVVDHTALMEALQNKDISGAALDVFPQEPLPKDSPLWDMPNVLLSPHIAGASKYISERTTNLFAENLHRYLTGQPLLNRFDPMRGY